jgi:hypothetical protein
MSAAREKDSADFDLERFIYMFDEALTSQDPRVVNALRSLMMMVTLTRPESSNQSIDRDRGPLKRLFEDVNHLNRRLHSLEDDVRQMRNREREAMEGYKKSYSYDYPYEKYDHSIQAAQKLATQVDQEVLNQLKATYRGKIQGLK